MDSVPGPLRTGPAVRGEQQRHVPGIQRQNGAVHSSASPAPAVPEEASVEQVRAVHEEGDGRMVHQHLSFPLEEG